MATALNAIALDWGAASMPLPGETECGDRYVVERFEFGAMVAMIDALGHGSAAAAAADLAAQTLSRHCREDPLALIRRCHASLRGTRGAAVSIAEFDAERRTISWIGIGNVAGVLVSDDPQGLPRLRGLLGYGGVVGDRLPETSTTGRLMGASVVEVSAGDTLILTTDGVGPYPPDVLRAERDPQAQAQRILDRYAKRTDDAAVLVARLNGKR